MAKFELDVKCLRASAVTATVLAVLVLSPGLVSAEQRSLKQGLSSNENRTTQLEVHANQSTPSTHHLSRPKGQSGYHHVWPELKFGWKIIVGTVIGFFGAACGSVGGVGGGGIFVPMLTLIIGFDPKSSTAMSKCMITAAAASTVVYNVQQRHPTLEIPIIDYDLALLLQPMLVLGISIGVSFNVIFADWMVTVLLITLFLVTSTKAFFRGIETWKEENKIKKEAATHVESNGTVNGIEELEGNTSAEDHINGTSHIESNQTKSKKVSIIKNIYWKELGILVGVWAIFLGLQISKNRTRTCSTLYWILNLLQIPVAIGASAYEAFCLYKGRRVIASKGDIQTTWRVQRLVLYCGCGILAGMLGGLLGLGGGFIMAPLFLELGIPPQVSSATATFVMMFSSSISVVEYYLLHRFPIPYALYFVAVVVAAAFTGQYVMKRVIAVLGRASLIIFILAGTIFVSAISLGGVGLSKMIRRIQRDEYMGFDNLCAY